MFCSIFPSCITHKHYVSSKVWEHFYLRSISMTLCISTVWMHTHNNRDVCEGGNTCDFKPHRNIRGFGGNDAHHVRHRVTFHYRKGEGGLLKKQGSCIGRQFWFGNPLDMKATSRGFLWTSIVNGFNLRERQRMKDCVTQCYATLCFKWVSAQLSGGSSAWNASEINIQKSFVMQQARWHQ